MCRQAERGKQMFNNTGRNAIAHNNFCNSHRNTIVNTINRQFAEEAGDELFRVEIQALLVGEGKRTAKKLFSWNRTDNKVSLGDAVADICEQYLINNVGQVTDIHPLVCHQFKGELQVVFDRRVMDNNHINIWQDKLNYERI